jgi:hypothetical protein
MKTLTLTLMALFLLSQPVLAESIGFSGTVDTQSKALDNKGVEFTPTTCALSISAGDERYPGSYEEFVALSFDDQNGHHSGFGITYYVNQQQVLPVFEFSKGNSEITLNREIDNGNFLNYSDGHLKISRRTVAKSFDTGKSVSIGGWIGGNVVIATQMDYSTFTFSNQTLTLKTVRYSALDPIAITGRVVQKLSCTMQNH